MRSGVPDDQRTIAAIDLDDVLFDFVTPFFDWHNRRYGTDAGPADLAGGTSLWTAWGGTSEEAGERVPLFFNEVDVLALRPIPGAIECLEDLRNRYQLALVTARDAEIAEATEAWIEKYFEGVFDRLILGIGRSAGGEMARSKADVCRQIGATVLVDDQLINATAAAEAGIRALLFGDYAWNQTPSLPARAIRVVDWSEVAAALG